MDQEILDKKKRSGEGGVNGRSVNHEGILEEERALLGKEEHRKTAGSGEVWKNENKRK